MFVAAAIIMTAGAVSAKNANAVLRVEGKCNMCKAKIEKAAKSVEGVTVAEWNKDTKVLRLSYDNATARIENISKAVAKAGYDTDKDKAPDDVYSAMHECCKYRE